MFKLKRKKEWSSVRQNKRFITFLFILWAIELSIEVWPVFPMNEGAKKMERMFPIRIGSYHSEGKDKFYNRKTIYCYINGTAEIYHSYGFKLLMVRRYRKTDAPSILFEAFDMGSSEESYGVFTYETEEEEVGIGQGSSYGGGLLRFWKGKFFFNLYPDQEGPSREQDIFELGKAIADSIKEEGPKPKMIHNLPQEGLIERSIRYFHHPHILNHHYFLSHENILHLEKRTNALFATYYLQKNEKTFLLMIQYPSPSLARKGFQSFVKAYMPEASFLNKIKTENGKWTAVQLYKNYMITVFDSGSVEQAENLIQATQKNIKMQ